MKQETKDSVVFYSLVGIPLILEVLIFMWVVVVFG